MEERFYVNHLRKEELEYELAIRGVFTSRGVNDKRTILSKLLSKETSKPGNLIDLDNYKVTYDNESAAITTTLESITTCIVGFEGTTTHSLFKAIRSRKNHVFGRIRRMKISDQDPSEAIEFKNESYATILK